MEDDLGNTLVSIYMMKKKLGFIRKLLIRGAEINYVNKFGKTAIHLAVENSLPENVIQFLIHEGANPHIIDQNGKDACDKANKTDLYPNIAHF